MARHGEAAKHAEPPTANLKPPHSFTAARWFFFTATVAIAIGMLALIDQRLTGIPWIYDGPLSQFQGRTVTIDFCLLSPTSDGSVTQNCNYAFAAASVSLGISLIWSYIQVLRRNPFKHTKARLADLALCICGALWWVAAGIFLSIQTHTANKSGLMQKDWRNGLCVLAWAQVLMFACLAVMSALMTTKRSQAMFDKWEAKHQHKKEQHEAAKAQKMRDEAAAADAAAAAARHSPAGAPTSAAAAHPAADAVPEHQGLPVSAWAMPHPVDAAGDANPFRGSDNV